MVCQAAVNSNEEPPASLQPPGGKGCVLSPEAGFAFQANWVFKAFLGPPGLLVMTRYRPGSFLLTEWDGRFGELLPQG